MRPSDEAALAAVLEDAETTRVLVLKAWNAEAPHFGGGQDHRYEHGHCVYCGRPEDYESGGAT